MNSVLESLVTALLGTLMAGNGNWQGGTAGGREGTAMCHLSCWKEGLAILSDRRGAARKAFEKDLGWALRNVQETTIWTSVTNSLSPGLPTPTRQELPGAGLGLVNKARLFSLTANF